VDTLVSISAPPCQTVWNVRYSLPFHQPIRGSEKGIGNLVFVTLPPKIPLRSTFQRSRGIISKGWHLFPWNACVRSSFPHPLAHCVHSLSALRPSPSLRSAFPSVSAHYVHLHSFGAHSHLRRRSGVHPLASQPGPIAHAFIIISSLRTGWLYSFRGLLSSCTTLSSEAYGLCITISLLYTSSLYSL